jgi:hypothetical protein
MRCPIGITVDVKAGAGYVRYLPAAGRLRQSDVVRTSTGTAALRVTGDAHTYTGVVIDFDSEDQVVGVELVDLVPETIALAKDFAAANNLGWPRDISGLLP